MRRAWIAAGWLIIAAVVYFSLFKLAVDSDLQGGDKLGQLIQWLYPRTPVFTWSVPGLWFDIASKENLEEANRIFAARR